LARGMKMPERLATCEDSSRNDISKRTLSL
jgi:hypothetical protein